MRTTTTKTWTRTTVTEMTRKDVEKDLAELHFIKGNTNAFDWPEGGGIIITSSSSYPDRRGK